MLDINVLLASDANYLPYLDIVLKSLLAHHRNLKIFILHKGDIPREFFEKRNPYFAQRESSIIEATIDPKNLEQFRSHKHISQSAYLRYYIEDLFAYSDSPFWIYLDCDIVINGDITAPFYHNMIATPLMAVSDPYINSLESYPYRNKDYFNSGVLYIYRDSWGYIKEDLIKLTNEHQDKLIHGDQDILNLYFDQNWVNLSLDYNFVIDNIVMFEKIHKQTNKQTNRILSQNNSLYRGNQTSF